MTAEVPARFSWEEMYAVTTALGVASVALREQCKSLREIVLDMPPDAIYREPADDALAAAERQRDQFFAMYEAYREELRTAEDNGQCP